MVGSRCKMIRGEETILVLLIATGLCAVLSPAFAYEKYDNNWPISWPNQGGGLNNTRAAPFETKISPSSLAKLTLKWTFEAKFDVSATPSVDSEVGAVYFPSWDGCEYAVKKDTGELIWKVNFTEIAPTIPGLAEKSIYLPYVKTLGAAQFSTLGNIASRSTPTIAGPLLVFGLYNPCYFLALNRSTGALVWWTSLDSHPWGVVTQSATYYEGMIYIGTSSAEESAPVCCTFIGAMIKLKATTGETIWKVPMVPDNHNQTGQFAGAAIWGSSPPIDTVRRLVYVATGNAYSTPPAITNCEVTRANETNPPIPDPCLLDDDHEESMVAINIDTGNIAWSTHLGGYDTWTLICALSPVPLPNCPPILGEDYDFGEAPLLISVNGRDLAVAGQKSGIVHALDRGTGEVVWQTDCGPGGTGGGASWGMATDGETVFTSIINSEQKNFTLVPSSKVITWGGWVAVNGTTGVILWSAANPDPESAFSPVAYANGVLFGGSLGNTTSGNPPGMPSFL